MRALILFSLLLIIGSFKSIAQTEPLPIDTLTNRVNIHSGDIDFFKRIKFTGYIQAQFQDADSAGISTFAGGPFPKGSDKRFMVRRGRFKAEYLYRSTDFVIQIDATEKGVILKDAYGKFTEPWMNAFSLTAGVFNRPFGFECPYSSGLRETPERARFSQTILPNERDGGAMLTFQMPKTSKWNFLKIDAGIFNGTGPNPDFDYKKDFIGSITLAKANLSEKIKLSGGISYYNGGIMLGNTTFYKMKVNADTASFVADNSKTDIYQPIKREYEGANFQATFEWVAGITTIRAEYIQGIQAGTKSTSVTPITAFPTVNTSTKVLLDTLGNTFSVITGTVNDNLYIRKFSGATFYFMHTIAHTPLQLIAKYDWYDPNTEVTGEQIGKSWNKNLSSTDIKYSTLGAGFNLRLDQNTKLLCYYDMVTNESTSLTKWTKDIKDNVLTVRFQYKF